ncbi:MAG: VanW family protein [Clostridia bacterium]|jgi:vancomycin resistance protein YoaR|nr:VanW family protein [Clostridia bacterium]
MTKGFRMLFALLAAGSVLLCGNAGGRVKRGVTIDGVEIGGLSYGEAEARVREQRSNASLTVRTADGGVSYTLDYRDDVSSLVRSAKRGQNLTSSACTEWVNAETELAALCKKTARDPVDAKVFFTKQGKFFYTPERQGLCCDYEKSLAAALAAVRGGKTRVALETRAVQPAVTVQALKERTQRLASFVTYFDGANADRSHNIVLACTRICGTILPAGGEFSFNATVGKRTEENGFRTANVIFEGEFVPGVGGGVCQASTTLMNCAVRAGLCVSESRPHSLSVSYVPPSCDAMVSEYSDLRLVNPYAYPVYIAAETGKSFVRFTVYGLPDGKRYALESSVTERVAPPPEKIIEGDEEKTVRAEKEGIASESYLCVYEGERLVSRTLFRRDRYAVVQGIKQVKKQEQSGQTPPLAADTAQKEEKNSKTP